jgi:hypothetical protein
LTQHLHRATAKSPWQRRLQHDSASSSQDPAMSSPAGLGNTIVSITQHLHSTMTKSSQQNHRQHYWTATSRSNFIVKINNI